MDKTSVSFRPINTYSIMIASVKYDDLKGSAAADVVDGYFNTLQEFLIVSYSSYDGNRFSCRGCSVFIGERNEAYVTFVCLDKTRDTFVSFSTPQVWPLEQFFQIFKRFNIVIGEDMNEIKLPDENEVYYLTNGNEE